MMPEHTDQTERPAGANGERLVAVATKGEGQIDLHFGHANCFSIYAAGNKGVRFVATREVEHYCQGGYGDEDKRDVILRVLADCVALFAAKIGDGPKARLLAAGIEPIDDYPYGQVETSISAWYARGEHTLVGPQ
jgi:nitrogen fixation protein NifB